MRTIVSSLGLLLFGGVAVTLAGEGAGHLGATYGEVHVGADCPVILPGAVVNALTVGRTYDRNEAAADENFLKKQLVISGRLVLVAKSLDAEENPIYVAELSPDGKPAKASRLAFIFPEADRGQLRCLSVGQYVRIRGECIGKVTGEPTPAPPPAPGFPPAPTVPNSEIQFVKCEVVR